MPVPFPPLVGKEIPGIFHEWQPDRQTGADQERCGSTFYQFQEHWFHILPT